jgi:hypothetical protein
VLLHTHLTEAQNLPSGVKAPSPGSQACGTAEAVPFQNWRAVDVADAELERARIEAIAYALPSTAHLKSFPSEKMKRGQYV